MEIWGRGVITTWHDDRLFGFITPDDGGEDLFFHISGWSQKGICPVEGFTVGYTLAMDPERGQRATRVHVREERRPSTLPAPAGPLRPPSPRRRFRPSYHRYHALRRNWLGVLVSICIALASLGGIAAAAYGGLISPVVPAVYAVASLVALLAYRADKAKARTGSWRMAESRLHFLELIGGWPGALVGQHLFKHKNRKASYQLEFWCIVALNVGALGWFALRDGQWGHFRFADLLRTERPAPTTPAAQGSPTRPSAPGAGTITINESDFKTGRNWDR